ncbi:hypothetical protein KCP77_08270 [Salmonella enterica subsp. enterica]|nr:hypothetical protein KCP77_08270 [Salmonella enterica subsp. enterica]
MKGANKRDTDGSARGAFLTASRSGRCEVPPPACLSDDGLLWRDMETLLAVLPENIPACSGGHRFCRPLTLRSRRRMKKSRFIERQAGSYRHDVFAGIAAAIFIGSIRPAF